MTRPDHTAAQRLLTQGQALHQAGDFAGAEAYYRQVLEGDPTNADALHLAGVLAYQLGQLETAERLIREALAHNARLTAAHNNLGLVLDARGRTVEAVAAYRQAIELKSDYAEAYSNLGIACKTLGRLDEAIRHYRTALRLKPDFADVHSNLGAALRLTGATDEAIAACTRALELRPQNPDALNNLGAAFSDAGRFDEAIHALTLALGLRQQFPAAQLNLAGVYRRQGQSAKAQSIILDLVAHRRDLPEAHTALGELMLEQGHATGAEAAFRHVIELRPEAAEAHNNLGNALRSLARPADAEAAYRQAVKHKPEYVEAHYNLCLLLQDQGRTAELEGVLETIFKHAPADPVFRARIRLIVEKLVPGWHVPMMNDRPRNQAYEAAIKRAAPGARVLDIGTGAGLLSLMAARAGARAVTTCEMVRTVAGRAAEIVRRNGLADRITVIARKSTDIRIGVEMAERADMLISEILSSDLVGEEALPSIEDAKARLIKPGARIIPAASALRGMIVGGRTLELQSHVGAIEGFDMGPFNALAPPRLMGHFQHHAVDVLSEPFDIFAFDFVGRDRHPAERRALTIPIAAAGRALGVLQWLRIDLDAETSFENHPLEPNPASGWQNIIYCFPEPIAVRPGDSLRLIAEHDRTKVLICLDPTRPAPPAPR